MWRRKPRDLYGDTAPSLQRRREDYFAVAGTGMTYLPSFSATKFSVELLELPLLSFVSTLIFNFFVGVSGSFALLPSGPVCTSAALLWSSGVRAPSCIWETLEVRALSHCFILYTSCAR